jgi:hypothetical protein
VHQAAKVCWNRRFDLAGGPDDAFGPKGIFVLGTYDKHNDWVREAARRNGNPILEWQPEQGWEPIKRMIFASTAVDKYCIDS